ncbi:hypothetical protein AIF0345_2426 [Actinomyces israelii]|nr:hypothetical protein AIF0345_2426 [Actinomyces israelii]
MIRILSASVPPARALVCLRSAPGPGRSAACSFTSTSLSGTRRQKAKGERSSPPEEDLSLTQYHFSAKGRVQSTRAPPETSIRNPRQRLGDRPQKAVHLRPARAHRPALPAIAPSTAAPGLRPAREPMSRIPDVRRNDIREIRYRAPWRDPCKHAVLRQHLGGPNGQCHSDGQQPRRPGEPNVFSTSVDQNPPRTRPVSRLVRRTDLDTEYDRSRRRRREGRGDAGPGRESGAVCPDESARSTPQTVDNPRPRAHTGATCSRA